MTFLEEQFRGCLLGLAVGDAFGAPYESGLLERLVWRVIGQTKDGCKRWTDDTQMMLDMAESLIANQSLDPDDLAGRFADSYRWSRGYGPATAKLLKAIKNGEDWRVANRGSYGDGSLGNGGAMRVPVIALYCHRFDVAPIELARRSAEITHAHPMGQEGAILIAMATSAALNQFSRGQTLSLLTETCSVSAFKDRLQCAADLFQSTEPVEPAHVVRLLGNGMTALESCVTALYIALCFMDDPFSQLLEYAIACGGDVDTIAAMAGAIWGARNGVSAMPHQLLNRLEARDRIEATASLLYGLKEQAFQHQKNQPNRSK